MKSFISVIYVKPNTVAEEKICVGIFVSSYGKSYFDWSASKLKAASKIASIDLYDAFKFSFQNFKREVTNTQGHSQESLFTEKLFTESYLSYFSKANKGLLEFTTPKLIPAISGDMEFRELVRLYVGSIAEENSPENKVLAKTIKKILTHPVIKTRADVNYKINENIIQTVYRSHTVDVISRNGSIYAAEIIDFNIGPETLEDRLFTFDAISKGLKEFAKNRRFKEPGTYEVFFNSPESAEQKKILDNVKKDRLKSFKLKDISELDKLSQKLESDNYQKFSGLFEKK